MRRSWCSDANLKRRRGRGGDQVHARRGPIMYLCQPYLRPRGHRQRFIPAFVERVKAIKVGEGFQPGMEVGPLINEETLDKVDSLVRDAVAKGAKVAAGGERLTTGSAPRAFSMLRRCFIEVKEDMPVCREEIFGPVAPVLTFRTEEELIERANDTVFGLASYFYTNDYARIIRVSEALDYGLVGVNDAAGYTHEIPFGGATRRAV